MQLDPHAESYVHLSGYNWVANNPLGNTDPTGMDIIYGGGKYGGDLYTGTDAYNLAKSLSFQSQYNNSGGDGDKNGDEGDSESEGSDDDGYEEVQNGESGYGNTFSERVSNPDLWLELGRSFLFGSDDPNVIQSAMPEAATWFTPVGGIAAYSKLAKITKGGKGLIQAHHIVEARHLKALGLSISEAPSIILSKLKHQQITNTLRELLPYGSKYSKQQIMNAYRQAYKEFPE